MKKIPTLFERDPEDRAHVTRDVNPAAAWVLDGHGTPTRKYDGTAVMLDEHDNWWARREVKPGKTPPPNFQAIDHDDTTGKTVGWEPIEQSPFVKFHTEALASTSTAQFSPGTFELVGPKIQGNPEQFAHHELVRHGVFVLDAPRDYDGLKTWLLAHDYEGIVWHHPDGRMAKLKRRDFA